MDPLTLFHKRIDQYGNDGNNPYIPNLREYISYNPAITIDMVRQDIQRHPHKKHEWKFHLLCRHIHIKDLFAIQIHPRPSDVFDLSCIVKIDIDTLIDMKDKQDWDWEKLTLNKHITIDDIAAHPELPWHYDMLLGNPNVTILHPLVLQQPPSTQHLLFNRWSADASYEDIQKFPDKPWSYRCLSSPNIRDKNQLLDLWHRFKHAYGASLAIAQNPALSFDDLKEILPEREFFNTVSSSPNITVSDVLKYPNETWCFGSLGNVLPIDFILTQKQCPWLWRNIYLNNKTLTYDILPKILPEIVPSHPDYGGYQPVIFYNPNFPPLDKKRLFEDLFFIQYVKHRKTCPDYLIASPFFLEPTFEEIRQHFAKKCIVRYVVHALTNPQYHQCRKRILKEYKTITM